MQPADKTNINAYQTRTARRLNKDASRISWEWEGTTTLKANDKNTEATIKLNGQRKSKTKQDHKIRHERKRRTTKPTDTNEKDGVDLRAVKNRQATKAARPKRADHHNQRPKATGPDELPKKTQSDQESGLDGGTRTTKT